WFGRCVFESDNDVCDDQVVVMTWDEESPTVPAKTAVFHMVAHTKKICDRYTHLYGVDGEVYADSSTIKVEDFRTGKTTVYQPQQEGQGDGGGEIGLRRQFLLAGDRTKNDGWEADRAQREFVGCTLEEVIRSHAMVFCAEEARRTRTVIDWRTWWAEHVEAR